MVPVQAFHPSASKGALRTVLTRAVSGIVLVLVLFAVGALTASLMLHSHAPQTLAARVHNWLALARPVVLALQLAGLVTIWWKWATIVKRAHFAADVEAAWLAARDRMFYWGLALMGLSVFLWSAR